MLKSLENSKNTLLSSVHNLNFTNNYKLLRNSPYQNTMGFINYRKRPCISRTFFHKIEAKNQGCGLSTDTSVFRVLKNLINIHKTS